MAERERFLGAVLEAVEVFNASMLPEERIEASERTPILGEASILDSLNLLQLVQRIEERLGRSPGLVGALIAADSVEPPMTLGALATRIAELGG